jgi:hypothetical protein
MVSQRPNSTRQWVSVRLVGRAVAVEPEPVPGARPAAVFSLGLLLAFCIGQLGLHAVMAGLRMAAPLQLLREGYGAGAVGFMLALFAAAPVLTALPAGRLVDRYGYHRPVLLALLSSASGAVLAIASTFTDGALHFGLLCLSAMATGVGANTGVMAIMRTAGLLARDSTERLRVFSWLSVAPAFANVIGPVSAGVMIDVGGFLAAYVLLGATTGLTLWGMLRVPRGIGIGHQSPAAGGSALGLLAQPGFKRLLLANWLLTTCWDAHSFAVPILGHERLQRIDDWLDPGRVHAGGQRHPAGHPAAGPPDRGNPGFAGDDVDQRRHHGGLPLRAERLADGRWLGPARVLAGLLAAHGHGPAAPSRAPRSSRPSPGLAFGDAQPCQHADAGDLRPGWRGHRHDSAVLGLRSAVGCRFLDGQEVPDPSG